MKHLLMIVTLLFVLSACGGGGSGGEYGPFGNVDADYQLWKCFKVYRWNGLFNTWKCPDGGWHAVSNQPIFTSNDDCHVAKHLLQQSDPNIWDEHDEAKKVLLRSAGSAFFLKCFEI